MTRLPGILAGNESYVFHDDAAPLRDFEAKLRLAFGLGLIGEAARSDLSLIRTMRNVFAHCRLHITFATPEVADAFEHFDIMKRLPGVALSTSADNADLCETFVQIGWAYASTLIVFEGEKGLSRRMAKILDVPHPSPETPK